MRSVDVSAAALCRDGRVLALRRSVGQSLAGYWEFPGGKRETGESSWQCLQREMLEELSIRISAGDFLACHPHQYADKIVSLSVFVVTQWSGGIKLAVHDQMRWLLPDHFEELDWAPADIAHLAPLRRRLQMR